MSESPPTPPPWRPAAPSVLRAGGAFGLAGAGVAMLIFVVGCFGFGAVYRGFPLLPLFFSVVGIVLSFIGAARRSAEDADTHVLFALFVNAIVLAAALLEIAVWQGWNLFYSNPVH